MFRNLLLTTFLTLGISISADEGMWMLPFIEQLEIEKMGSNLSPEQIEAARMDGAKGWTMLRHIIIPQLRPATFIAVVVTVIGALRSFDLVASMTAGGPYGTSSVLAFFMYEQAIFNYRLGYGAAIATVLFLIMLIYIAFFLWRMLKDERG